jgi:hypothetical protein
MPKKSAAQQDAERRAEARRRARLAAQGRVFEESDDEVDEAPVRQSSGSVFQRLFPPAAPLPGKGDLFGSIASFVSFGALVAAGWIGWQRPWFFGLAAATIGYLLYTPYFIYTVANAPVTDVKVTASQVTLVLVTNGIVQIGIGALAGFYGGYLRRRLADPATRQTAGSRRRR